MLVFIIRANFFNSLLPYFKTSILTDSLLLLLLLVVVVVVVVVVGHAVGLQTGRSRVRFPVVLLEFFIDIILSAALWPWGRLSL